MNFTTTHIRSEKVTIDTRIYTISSLCDVPLQKPDSGFFAKDLQSAKKSYNDSIIQTGRFFNQISTVF